METPCSNVLVDLDFYHWTNQARLKHHLLNHFIHDYLANQAPQP